MPAQRLGGALWTSAKVAVFLAREPGLEKVAVQRGWEAPIDERPIAPGHHRFDWFCVAAFVSPVTGETYRYVRDCVSKPFSVKLLAAFAREAAAGVSGALVIVS